MTYKNNHPSALSAVMNSTTPETFSIDPSIIEQSAQYHLKQVVENKTNPVARQVHIDRVIRANNAEREDFKKRQESKNNAERRWKELFNG